MRDGGKRHPDSPEPEQRGRLLAYFERWIPDPQREFLVGDLIESFHQRRHDRGLWQARWWLSKEIIGLVRHGWIQPSNGRHRVEEHGMSQAKTSLSEAAAEWTHTLFRDLRVAVRRWCKAPTSAAVVMATLTLGIGFNTLVFMLADLVLFRPASFHQPHRLVSIETNTGGSGWYGASEPELVDLEQLDVFEAVGAWTGGRLPVQSERGDRRLEVARVTENMLPLLGTTPLFGRFPDAEEGLPGADPVIVLSHGLWQREMGGRRDVLGETMDVAGRATQIIGVMPPGFVFPDSRIQAWVPLPFDRNDLWTRNNHYLNVIARLAADVDVEQARTALAVLTSQSASAYPEFYAEHGYRTQTQTLRRAQTANERMPMMILLTSVGLLLLLTCANVANIQLGRGASRGREMAVRRALGASTDRLIAEQMADALVIAVAGGLCALGLATLGARLMPVYLPERLLRFGVPTLDLRILGFTLGVTLLATLAFGLWPAIRSLVSAGPTVGSAHAGARYASPSRSLRSALVIGQMALACVLLVGCGMTVRSLFNLIQVDPGFSPEGVLVIDAAPPATVLDSPERVVSYYRAVESELAGMAGVSAAGSLARLPMTGSGNTWSIEIEGRPAASIAAASSAQVQQATPGAFAALDINLLRGRLFDARDTADSEPVVVINALFADEFWPNEDAIGKRFRVYSDDAPFMRVVGVVANLRDASLDREGRSQWYVPHAQAFQSAYVSPREMRILVRTGLDTPTDMASSVIERLQRLNPGVPLVDPVNLPDTVASSLSLPRQMALWLAVFAAVALLLAGLGLYGVLSFLVTVRKSEIGIRMALGADPRKILARVLAEGLALCSAGLLLGLGLGVALSQLASDFFFEIEPVDPQVLGATLVVLLTMGVLAPLAPARRAGRTDPCVALREE